MKHQAKFLFLILILVSSISLFFWDRNRVNDQIKQFQKKIKNIDNQLSNGSNIMNEIKKIQQLFEDKKIALKSYHISGSELANEIKKLNDLSKNNGLNVTNIETYSENTFPPLNDYLEDEKIPLKRHALSFQLTGNFLKIGTFMESLKDNSNELHLEHCSFVLDKEDPRGVVAQLQYLTYGEDSP
tara:strand:+ start:6131 stop:6685 length:555 start_codon:yes stop_codon:yes gene_type:complete